MWGRLSLLLINALLAFITWRPRCRLSLGEPGERRSDGVRLRGVPEGRQRPSKISAVASRGLQPGVEHGDHATLTPGRTFVDSVLARESIPGSADLEFAPVLRTLFQRSTLFLPETASRVTIDTELRWEDDRSRLRLPGLAIVEPKTGSTASRVDRLLWTGGYRPTRISKYATGMAALRPDLSATRWRRTLRRYFVPAVPLEPSPSHLLSHR